MRTFCAVILLGFGFLQIRAQASKTDQMLLSEVREKYDDPFARGLQSFSCAVNFDWKLHWVDTTRVGDEGTDAEIEKLIQPLHHRVTVTRDDAVVSSGISEEEEHKLPHGGMAVGLLKHAVSYSLRNWLVASNNMLLPAVGTPIHFESSTADYKLEYKVKTFDVAMMLTRDMSLQSMGVNGSNDDRQEFSFSPAPQGFVLNAWTMGENGVFKPGNRLVFTYKYQDVDGFQIPTQMVVNRESHHEVWRYTLSDCIVKTNK